MAQKCLSVLHFMIQKIHVCMDLVYVVKVLPLPLLETVPTSPNYCAGLMNFKNTCIPVWDLAISIGLYRNEIYPLDTPILLCSDGNKQIGLIVDKIVGISEIDRSKIEMNHEVKGTHSPFLGALPQETNVALFINRDWLFSLALSDRTHPCDTHHERPSK